MTAPYEFSFTIPAVKIGADAYKANFEADARARGLLAKRYGILSIESLKGSVSLRRESDGMTIHASGDFLADVTQACVTTLDPVVDHIAETFESWYLDESQATSFTRAKKRLLEIEAGDMPLEDDESPLIDERDEPEPVINGMIDVGELVAQFLSLALNPFPHSEKALAQGPLGDESTLKKTSPFDVLKDLKTK